MGEEPGTSGPSGSPAVGPRVVLEVVETPIDGPGCSRDDRRVFRGRTVPRLLEEFGVRLEIRWEEPAAKLTSPTLIINGSAFHNGGYMPWEILRGVVAHALALEEGVDEFARDVCESLAAEGVRTSDWQDGLLVWLRRCGDADDTDPGDAPLAAP